MTCRFKKIFILVCVFLFCFVLEGCDKINNGDKNNNKNELFISSANSGVSISSLIDYEINIDKKDGNFNEEIKVSIKLFMISDFLNYFFDGPLYIKLDESLYYEIVGNNEFIVHDFNTEEYFLSNTRKTIGVTFIIKPLEYSFFVNHLNIRIKFNTDVDYLRKHYLFNNDSNFYVDLSKEYFLNIPNLVYVINSNGIHFSGFSNLDSMGDIKDELFYSCLNDEYNEKNIYEEDYINYVYEYITDKKVYIKFMDLNDIRYVSKNIRAHFILSEDYSYLIENKINAEYDVIAKELIYILYESGEINLDLYNKEIQYISENKITTQCKDISYDLISVNTLSSEKLIQYTVVK